MKRTKDAESLVIDILTFLTGISSRDGEKFPVLRRAIRSVTQSKQRGLFRVIDELRKDGSPVAENIADHIESMTDYDFAHLLFSDGDVEQSISLDRQLNIISWTLSLILQVLSVRTFRRLQVSLPAAFPVRGSMWDSCLSSFW